MTHPAPTASPHMQEFALMSLKSLCNMTITQSHSTIIRIKTLISTNEKKGLLQMA